MDETPAIRATGTPLWDDQHKFYGEGMIESHWITIDIFDLGWDFIWGSITRGVRGLQQITRGKRPLDIVTQTDDLGTFAHNFLRADLGSNHWREQVT